MPFSRIRPPSELASGVSNATTSGLSFGSNWNVTCAIQAVAIEPPRLSAPKRPDTASIAPARDSVALLFHRSRIVQARTDIVPKRSRSERLEARVSRAQKELYLTFSPVGAAGGVESDVRHPM